jgi:thioredoxin reductase
MEKPIPYDVVIVGGGPAGLSAALIFGRARKRVALFDAGSPRNAAATHINGFVTRDGTPPAEFRRIGREQLRAYPAVEVRDAAIESITREGELFTVSVGDERIEARRVLLCVGMIDELPDLPGARELWGKSIFQCPYCHAWEIQDRAFGVLATSLMLVEFALFLTGWTRDLVVFTGGAFPVPEELRARLDDAGVRVEERPIRALRARDGHLDAVELVGGEAVARDVLFTRTAQRQTALVSGLVSTLGLELDEQGYVRVSEQKATSVAGVHAAGDLTTMLQGALMAAAAGAQAAYMMNHGLTLEAVAREGARRAVV